jgi:hypothetical protein
MLQNNSKPNLRPMNRSLTRSNERALRPVRGEDRIIDLKNPPAIQDTFSRHRDISCRVFGGYAPASYGGPAALSLNESLKVLAGRDLDRLYRQTNGGSWAAPTPDAQTPQVRFAVE